MVATVSDGNDQRGDRQELPRVLTDGQWLRIALILPRRRQLTGRRRTTTLRAIVEALCWQRRTRRPWRQLPPGFPPWQTVYGYFRTWSRDGTLRRIRAILDDTGHPTHQAGITRQESDGTPVIQDA